MIRQANTFAAIAFSALTLVGCTIFPVPDAARVMDFAPSTDNLAVADTRWPYSLRVETPVSSEPFTSSHIIAKPNVLEIQVYGGVRWRDSAPVIVRDALTRALRSNQGFERVITDVNPAEADLTLVTELLRFHTLPEADRTVVIISLYSEILQNRSRKTACAEAFDIQANAASNQIDDLVAAFDNAGQRLARELTLWANTCHGLESATKVNN